MFNVGDKVICVLEEGGVYVESGEIFTVVEIDKDSTSLDILVANEDESLEQWANSKKFVKVEY